MLYPLWLQDPNINVTCFESFFKKTMEKKTIYTSGSLKVISRVYWVLNKIWIFLTKKKVCLKESWVVSTVCIIKSINHDLGIISLHLGWTLLMLCHSCDIFWVSCCAFYTITRCLHTYLFKINMKIATSDKCLISWHLWQLLHFQECTSKTRVYYKGRR